MQNTAANTTSTVATKDFISVLNTNSACVGCPYHDDMEWKWLKENEPDSFREAVLVDRAVRTIPEARGSLNGEAYLHRSRKPLDEVDFDGTRDYDEYMASECEGLCGV